MDNRLGISIHLMLMLITALPTGVRQVKKNFNTSHVNVNHDSLSNVMKSDINFNTSHVNVNPMNLSLFQSRLNLSLPILSHFSKNYQPISLFLTMGLISLLPQVFTGLLEIFFINCLVNTSII